MLTCVFMVQAEGRKKELRNKLCIEK